jgi:Large polyvalent protein-associated domain 7
MSDDRAELRPTKRQSDVPDLPDALARKYLRVGRDIYRSSDDKKPIATLKADKITTQNSDALRDVIHIAKANGWTAIKVEGSPEFKRSAYLEASLQGLSVIGYQPTKLVEAEAERNRTRFAESEQSRIKQPTLAVSGKAQAALLAERFRNQSHAENAKDKYLRKAQELVAVAIATARGQFPGDLKAQEKFVVGKKAFIAEALARGDEISGVKLVAKLPQISSKPPLVIERSAPFRGR